MDYKKRDTITSEIDVLINRLVTLQEQKKKYKDLTQSLKTLESEIDTKQRFCRNLSNKVSKNKENLNALNEKIIAQEGAIKKNENTIASGLKEYNSINISLGNLINTHKDYTNKVNMQDQEFEARKKRLDFEYKDIVKAKKQEIIDFNNTSNELCIAIEKNKKQIVLHQEQLKSYATSIDEIKIEYAKHNTIKGEKDNIIAGLMEQIETLEKNKDIIIKESNTQKIEIQKLENRKNILVQEIYTNENKVGLLTDEQDNLKLNKNTIEGEIKKCINQQEEAKKELQKYKKKIEIVERSFKPLDERQKDKERCINDTIQILHNYENEVIEKKKELQDLNTQREKLFESICIQKKKCENQWNERQGEIKKIQDELDVMAKKFANEKEKYEGKTNMIVYEYEKLLKDKKEIQKAVENNTNLIDEYRKTIEDLKGKKDELEVEYQKLLENFIIKT